MLDASGAAIECTEPPQPYHISGNRSILCPRGQVIGRVASTAEFLHRYLGFDVHSALGLPFTIIGDIIDAIPGPESFELRCVLALDR